VSSISASAPKIGFDRYIALDWAVAAMRLRGGMATTDDLKAILDGANFGPEARKKTVTVLNRLWIEPRPELTEFANRGAAISRGNPEGNPAALCWGMAIAVYPFFARVAELVGRLTAIQGDCTAVEVHRRMSEIYGEREGTRRMTNMVLQTQADWGILEKADKGRRIVRLPTVKLSNDVLVAWLIEAALRFVGRSVPVASLGSMSVLYPFELDRPLGYVVSGSPSLELRSDGPANQVVALRD